MKESSAVMVWNANYETKQIVVRFLQEVGFMHSCTETNTFVLAAPTTRRPDVADDLGWDLMNLNGNALPFGQIVFLSYHSEGNFLLEAASERFKPHIVEQAFASFGYGEVKLVDNYLTTSDKDTFKLVLQYGS